MNLIRSLVLAALLCAAPAFAQTVQPPGGGGGSTLTPGQLPGTATNDNASAGNVGQVIDSTIANPGSNVTNGVSTNVTSLSLTAGDWEVSGLPGFSGGATTTLNSVQASISTTTGALNGAVTVTQFFNNQTVYANVAIQLAIPPTRFNFASTTTVFLVCNQNFAVSTASCFGSIHAIRVR